MKNLKSILLASALSLVGMTSPVLMAAAQAATAEDINRESTIALQNLYRINPTASELANKARAILVFPNIIKAAFIFGGAYGEGELKIGSKIEGYYNSVTGSWGLQAGGQSYGYVVFLMSAKALDYVHQSQGWELGVGPSVVVVDAGAAKNLSTSTLQEDAYAFIFDQQGVMIALSIEGTKISQISR